MSVFVKEVGMEKFDANPSGYEQCEEQYLGAGIGLSAVTVLGIACIAVLLMIIQRV